MPTAAEVASALSDTILPNFTIEKCAAQEEEKNKSMYSATASREMQSQMTIYWSGTIPQL